MANSRKRHRNPDRFEAALEAALDAACGAQAVPGAPGLEFGSPLALGIAFSGGADSMLLLETACAVSKRRQWRLVALHVHHGLSPNAQTWVEACEAATRRLGVELRTVRVTLERIGGESLEACARTARYAALESLCRQLALPILLTGHHADDQAETILLNLARGAGVAGLSGIATRRSLGASLVLRPFLGFGAAEIRATLRQRSIGWVEDESNRDETLRRNAIRHRLIPVLGEIVPGARDQLARAAQAAAQAQQLLDERGLEDLERLEADAQGFCVLEFPKLSHARAVNALRTWFRHYRGHAPSSRFLDDMFRQLLRGLPSSRAQLIHGDEQFYLINNRLTSAPLPPTLPPAPVTLQWHGEAVVDLPAWGGRIVFAEQDAVGLSAAWLRSVTLTVRPRQGGERLRLASNRPSKTLKNLYQECGISERQRARLPLVYANNELVWAAGLGLDVRRLGLADAPRILLSWEAHAVQRS